MIRKNTWIILGIFALLLVVAYLWQRADAEKTEAASTATADFNAAGQQFVFQLDGEIVGLRIEKVGDGVVDLIKDSSNQWQLTSPADVVTDQTAVQTYLSQVSGLTPLSTLQEAPELASLGLDPPQYRILVKLDDGDQAIANVGKATVTGSGYYVLTSDRKLYVVNLFSLDSLLSIVSNPPVLQPTETPTATEELQTTPAP